MDPRKYCSKLHSSGNYSLVQEHAFETHPVERIGEGSGDTDSGRRRRRGIAISRNGIMRVKNTSAKVVLLYVLSFKTRPARRSTDSLERRRVRTQGEIGRRSLFPSASLRRLYITFSRKKMVEAGEERWLVRCGAAKGVGRWSVKQRVEGKLKRSSRKKGGGRGREGARSLVRARAECRSHPRVIKNTVVVLAIRMTNDVVDGAKLVR